MSACPIVDLDASNRLESWFGSLEILNKEVEAWVATVDFIHCTVLHTSTKIALISRFFSYQLLVDYDNHGDVGKPAYIGYIRGAWLYPLEISGSVFHASGDETVDETFSFVMMNDADWILAGVF